MRELFHAPRFGFICLGVIGAANVFLGLRGVDRILSDGAVIPEEVPPLLLNTLGNFGFGMLLVGLAIAAHLKPQGK